jgi:hypothetical protein
MKLIPTLGWLFFIFVTMANIARFGTHWEFGRYGMPSSTLAADGRTYLDGTEVDPVSLAIARSGWEEEFYLGALIMLAVLVGVTVWQMIRLQRMQMAAFEREIRRIRAMRRDDERR